MSFKIEWKGSNVTSASVCLNFMLDPYFKTMKSTNWKFKIFKNSIEAEKWCTE